MEKQATRSHVFLSRIGGICLLLLGVHSAAGFFNRTAFRIVDASDLVLDQLAWVVLQKLGNLSLLDASTAESASSAVARWIDIAEKEVLAGVIGVFIELACVVFLADFAWGYRPDPGPSTQDSSVQNSRYRRVFNKSTPPPAVKPSRFRLESVAVLLTLGAFTMSGLCFLAVAVEALLFRAFEPYPSINRYIVPAGASLGVVLGVACLARFLPEMLVGAYRRSLVRIHRGLQILDDEGGSHGSSLFQKVTTNLPRYIICDTRRGALVMVALLPLGVFSLLASVQLNVASILASLSSMP